MKKIILVLGLAFSLGFGTLTGILYGSGSTWNNVYCQYKTNLIVLETYSYKVHHKVTFDEKVRLYTECFRENIHCKGFDDIKSL